MRACVGRDEARRGASMVDDNVSLLRLLRACERACDVLYRNVSESTGFSTKVSRDVAPRVSREAVEDAARKRREGGEGGRFAPRAHVSRERGEKR